MATPILPAIPRSAARRRLSNKSIWALIFIAPIVLYLVVFSLGPILFSLWVSMSDWNLVAPLSQMKFQGPG